jgi:hypothetical protein
MSRPPRRRRKHPYNKAAVVCVSNNLTQSLQAELVFCLTQILVREPAATQRQTLIELRRRINGNGAQLASSRANDLKPL